MDLGCGAAFAAAVFAWLIFATQKPGFVHYLQSVGFGEDMAGEIAAFSIGQAGWFILFFGLAIGLFLLAITGVFSGKRARLCGILLGALLIVDLGRANLPYVIHWNYKQKYDIDPANPASSTNPIINFLRAQPYEHRVAYGLPAPMATPPQFEPFSELYRIEWAQHHFPYYNIQSLDKIQMPRRPADLEAFEDALRISIRQDSPGQWMMDPATFPLVGRLWELTNTRYLLGPAALLDFYNEQFDPFRHRFRILQRFTVALKPGVEEFHQKLEELTAIPNDNGEYAVIEFTGALPRARLYSNWQFSTNDAATLKTLINTNFDPWQAVLVSTPLPAAPAANATGQNAGPVEFKSYAPTDIMFSAQAGAPSVLLINDMFDPHWTVRVDGRPAPLLRCNFIMRGVYLTTGPHTVEFQYHITHGPLYVSLAAIGVGILLCGLLIFSERRNLRTKANCPGPKISEKILTRPGQSGKQRA